MAVTLRRRCILIFMMSTCWLFHAQVWGAVHAPWVQGLGPSPSGERHSCVLFSCLITSFCYSVMRQGLLACLPMHLFLSLCGIYRELCNSDSFSRSSYWELLAGNFGWELKFLGENLCSPLEGEGVHMGCAWKPARIS